MRRAFTLVEITLALGILCTGVLAIVGLYALGFRESRQSREDVGATAVADIIFSQLTAAVSYTNLSWKAFSAATEGKNGWGDYFSGDNLKNDPTSIAEGVFNDFIAALNLPNAKDYSFPRDELSAAGLHGGLVIQRSGALVRFAFRATSRPPQLLASPMFYGSAKFMGVEKGAGE